MAVYTVEVKETLVRTLRVDAENASAAKEEVEKRYKDQEIVLNSGDHICTDITVNEEQVEIPKKHRDVVITVPENSVNPFKTDERFDLRIDRELLLGCFRELILPTFRGDDDSVSDDGLLDEWLDEYNPFTDDTSELFEWLLINHTPADVKDVDYYSTLYNVRYNALLRHFKDERACDPEYLAEQEFDSVCTPEEDAGYWTERYGCEAYRHCLENTEYNCMNAHSIAVIGILKALYEKSVNGSMNPPQTDDAPKRAFVFETGEGMRGILLHACDLYNPNVNNGTYIFQYNEEGAVCVYSNITRARARYLSRAMKEQSESGWQAFLPIGGTIFEDAMDCCNQYFAFDGWVRADAETYKDECVSLDEGEDVTCLLQDLIAGIRNSKEACDKLKLSYEFYSQNNTSVCHGMDEVFRILTGVRLCDALKEDEAA